MTRTGARTALAVAMVAALTPLSGGCTSADEQRAGDDRATRASVPSAAATAALRAAERATERAASARVRSVTAMGSLMTMSADGVLGWSDGITGTLTLTYTGGTVADTMRRLGSTSMEARYLPDAYYARMGDAFAAQAGGRHWVKYAYDDLDELAGSQGAQLQEQMRQTTPDRSVRLLLDSGDVRVVGTETVRGERTTRYAGTVDTEDDGLAAQTVDLWINERDLLVKKVEKGRTATGESTQTAYYSDYGAEVRAEEPPAHDTQDVRELLDRRANSTEPPEPLG